MEINSQTLCLNCNHRLISHTSEELYHCSLILLRTFVAKPKHEWKGYNGDLELCPYCNLEFEHHAGLQIMDCVRKLMQDRPN